MTTLGKQLYTLRIAANKTQLDVANACGFTTAQFVSNWERDVPNAKPSPAVYGRLSRVLGIRCATLIDMIYDHEVRQLESQRQSAKRGLKEA